MGFIFAINDAIKGVSNSQGSADASENIDKIIGLLNILSQWIDEILPIQQPQRFGNAAFKTWYNRLKDVSSHISLFKMIFIEVFIY